MVIGRLCHLVIFEVWNAMQMFLRYSAKIKLVFEGMEMKCIISKEDENRNEVVEHKLELSAPQR